MTNVGSRERRAGWLVSGGVSGIQLVAPLTNVYVIRQQLYRNASIVIIEVI